MSYRFTILGCGPSGGVPRLGPYWGKCDPQNPKNRRRRCAALVERAGPGGRSCVLIDTPPDLREQLLSVRADRIDAVFYTHDHADHTHGIDDLRSLAYIMKRRIDVYADAVTSASLLHRFNYCFERQPTSNYAPILKLHVIEGGGAVPVDGAGGAIELQPIAQLHGDVPSLGFRIGSLAYSPDISDVPEVSLPLLEGLDVWIVDALRYEPHDTHFSIRQALRWIERLKPRRAVLTHMTTDLDYDTLRRDLPANVEPAYDGMVIEFK